MYRERRERAIASHAHHDFGSFILFHNKKEILLDPEDIIILGQIW